MTMEVFRSATGRVCALAEGIEERIEGRLYSYEAAQVVLEDRWKLMKSNMDHTRSTLHELVSMD